MLTERTDREPESRTHHQESILAAMALLLGPETDYHVRVRATQRLARQGPAVLPVLLATLSNYPEISSPPWPWWPPQYEHCSRLLIRLSQKAQLRLEALLQHPAISQPAGPVLWTSVMEAGGLLQHAGYESLLCAGLAAPWGTVRYAAAMALADFGGKVALCKPTLDALRVLQREEEPIPVRLVASYALLRHHDNSGIEALIKLLQPQAPVEARKAAAFVLAAEPPTDLPPLQRDQLTRLLILALEDPNGEAALHAAQALRNIATPAALSSLCALLDSPHSQVQIAALTALEEVASRTAMRRVIQHHTLPTQVVLLLRSETPEVRRQASYTLAACGGEYAAAVLGTTLLNNNHPAHLEAIEALRLLHGALRAPTRTKVARWLLRSLRPGEASSDKDLQEEVQVTALDSLGYLAWQARVHRQKRAWHEISTEILHDATASQLLACPSAWVRQRAVEMLSMLDSQPDSLHTQLLQLLHSDDDSGVRACVAYTLGQTAARWAIPDLIQTLLDPDEHVAETALNALSHLATPDDPIINYVMEELAACGHTKGSRANRLSRSAHALLKKWRHKL